VTCIKPVGTSHHTRPTASHPSIHSCMSSVLLVFAVILVEATGFFRCPISEVYMKLLIASSVAKEG